MKTQNARIIRWLLIAAASIILTVAGGGAEEKKDMQGWGIDDPYNQHYEVREFATALFVRYIVRSAPLVVIICPSWFSKQ